MTKPVRTSYGRYFVVDHLNKQVQTYNDVIDKAIAKALIESEFDPQDDFIFVSHVSALLNETNEYFDTIVSLRKA